MGSIFHQPPIHGLDAALQIPEGVAAVPALSLTDPFRAKRGGPGGCLGH